MLRIKKGTIVLDIELTSTGISIQQVVAFLPPSKPHRHYIHLLIQSLEIIAKHQLRIEKEKPPRSVLENYFWKKGWSVWQPAPFLVA